METDTSTQLVKRLPSDSYMPRQPVVYSKHEELELIQRIRNDLPRFNPRSLESLYIELAAYDGTLSGFINFQDLIKTFRDRRVSVWG